MSYTPETKESNDLEIARLQKALLGNDFTQHPSELGFLVFKKGGHTFKLSRIRGEIKYNYFDEPISKLCWGRLSLHEAIKFFENLNIIHEPNNQTNEKSGSCKIPHQMA